MISRITVVGAAFGASILLACSGEDPPATIDSGVDGAAQDSSAQDATAQDSSAQDSSVSDAPSEGATGDAASVDGGLGALCVSTGGNIGTAQCCKNTTDFPSTCATGACGCSPQNSHMVADCQCPAQKCFDPKLGCK